MNIGHIPIYMLEIIQETYSIEGKTQVTVTIDYPWIYLSLHDPMFIIAGTVGDSILSHAV